MTELQVRNITKKYKDKLALHDVNLNITKGVWGLLGANGAGKTTLMRIITGSLQPSNGEIIYNGINIKKLDESYRDKLGYLPQKFGYYPSFTVQDYLEYIGTLKGLTKQDINVKMNQLLEELNLSDVKRKKIIKLSGGMQRRVGIAQAMLNEPEVLVLDEPTAGLDPGERINFRKYISDFAQKRLVIVSTHIVSDIEHIAERNIIMNEGEVFATGTTHELLERIEDKVWVSCVKPNEVHLLEDKLTIVNMKNELDGTVEIRYVASQPIDNQSLSIDANLEDLYLSLFNHKEELD